MPLHLRRRGEIWHARGTVRVGRQSIAVREFSTGCDKRTAAEAVAAEEEARIRSDTLDGPAGRTRRLTIADCIAVYGSRPGGSTRNDNDKLLDLNERIGSRTLDDAEAAWADIVRTRGANWTSGTAARWRAILQAALNAGAKANGCQAPRIATVKEPTREVVTYLSLAERERLLAAYSRNAAPVAVVLAFTGMRTQEALRLDWRRVSWQRGNLFIPGVGTKSGRGRSIPMHDRVREVLSALWEQRKRPDTGPVFLSLRGKPYADTRGIGGNPLAKAHQTACKGAGITGFRVHDWRHHWASWMVMEGADLVTLMRLGGWTTPRMVQRYAAVSAEHMERAIARLR